VQDRGNLMLFERFVPEEVWKRVRPDAVYVWLDEDVRRRLAWYYRVFNDEAPAKFMLAKAVEAGENPAKLDLENLLDLRRKLHAELENLRREALEGSLTLEAYLREFRSKPRALASPPEPPAGDSPAPREASS
jgi:putative pyruvate formate lyase activating enzyme